MTDIRTRGFEALEEKYGITIESEGHTYFPKKGRSVETFRMYSADGCCWEKGLSRKGVNEECKRWSKELLEIKEGERS